MAGCSSRIAHPLPRVTHTPAFTLVEMMVVIGILALLIALIVPVTTSLLERNKRSQTLATMKVLEQAIAAFSNVRPLAKAGTVRLRPTGQPSPHDWAPESVSAVFGSLPPTPTSRLVNPMKDPLDFTIVLPPWGDARSYTVDGSVDTTAKFGFLLALVKNGPWEYKRKDPTQGTTNWAQINWLGPDPAKDAASIECLVFCLNELCTESRSILSQLPAASKVNDDKDMAYENLVNPTAHKPEETEKMIDLIEIIDAWKRPLRYAVKEPAIPDPITGAAAYPATWELRSAGPDGLFADPFTAEDVSDDVILKGT